MFFNRKKEKIPLREETRKGYFKNRSEFEDLFSNFEKYICFNPATIFNC